jgi:mRNA-degrading endonuclease RelE of RelBE toxin-antitoxin system
VAEYSLAIKPSAKKELDDLDNALFRRIEQKILMLAGNPRPPGCRKLKGHSDSGAFGSGITGFYTPSMMLK